MNQLSPEVNDIDISKLFNWGGKLVVIDRSDKEIMTIYIRLVGDAELNRARVAALRQSAVLRRKLRNLDSDERIAYIPEKEAFSKDSLIESILVYKTRELTIDAIRTIRIKLPKEPKSDASLEEQEKYQKEVDEFKERQDAEIKKFISTKIEQERNKLLKKEFDNLYFEYENLVINQYSELEFINTFKDFCIYCGSYIDENYKVKLFSSFEEYQNLPKDIKDQFVEFYNNLEIGTDELKN